MNQAERDAINRRFAKLVGLCQHEPASNFSRYCQKCGKTIPKEAVTGNIIYSDFIAHPTLALKEMMKREDWFFFLDQQLGGDYYPLADPLAGDLTLIPISYILDETEGSLVKAAIEFMEKEAV
jgi:hypothetical protein